MTLHPLTIRDYEPGDFAGLFTLDQQCFAPGIAYSRDELAYFVRAGDAFTLVALIGAELAGFAIVQLYRGRATYQARIITIDVSATHRRGGIAHALMADAEQRMREMHVRAVRLEVSVENHAAQAFYRKLGFVETGRISRYYLDSIDALTMVKTLT